MTALIMGVINVTPDSFSDGGRYLSPEAALKQAERLIEEGADILDLGGESTKPGAPAVSEDEEWRRLEPVLRVLAKKRRSRPVLLSIDTQKPVLMRRAADLGAAMINNVAGLCDAETLATLARYPGMHYLAMHMHGTPETMQREPLRASAAVRAVDHFFATAQDNLSRAGFSRDRIWLDPGIGFGKSDAGNVQLMARIPTWAAKHQVAIGVSRKSLIGRTLGIADAADRDPPTKTLELGLAIAGARLVRTHDVARLKKLLTLLAEGEG